MAFINQSAGIPRAWAIHVIYVIMADQSFVRFAGPVSSVEIGGRCRGSEAPL